MQQRSLLLTIALVVLAGSCGGSDSSAQESTSAPAEPSSTTAPATSTTAPTTSTTVPPTDSTRAPTETGSPYSHNWSRVPDEEGALGGAGFQMMSGVTVGGPGLVAVGSDFSGGDVDAAVWTSADGITWSRVPHDEAVFGGDGDQEMVSVTTGGPGLVAVGWEGSLFDQDAAVWTSPDGITWSRVAHDEAVFGGDGDQEMVSVTTGGPGLVAVGPDLSDLEAEVWTSPDGITWSRLPADTAVFGGSHIQSMLSVTTGGPGLIAVGWEATWGEIDATAWTSDDGISWSRVASLAAVFAGEGVQSMMSATAGGPGLVAVGLDSSAGDENAAIWTSPDGIGWSRVPDVEAVFGGLGNQGMASVTAGDTGVVAVGQDGWGGDFDAAVWTSPDGITWARLPNDTAVFGGEGDQVMMSVTVGGPGIVAVGREVSDGTSVAAVWVATTQD